MLAIAPCLMGLLVAAAPGDVEATYKAAAGRVAQWMSRPEVLWRHEATAAGPRARPLSQEALPVLLESAQSEDAATRLRALEGLAQSGGADYARVFVSALSDPSQDVRDLAVRILATLDAAVTFETVMAVIAAGGQEANGICAALPALQDSLESRTLDLLKATAAPRSRKLLAAWCLGQMRSTRAAPDLAELAWSADAELAVCCAQALVALRDPLIVPQAAQLTAHPMPEVRSAVLEGLADLADPEALEALGRVAAAPPLDDRDLSRRAVELLGATGDDNVIPLLIEAMRRNLWARRAAGDVLRRMTGKLLGDLPSDWADWYEQRQQPQAPSPSRPPPEPFAEVVVMPD